MRMILAAGLIWSFIPVIAFQRSASGLPDDGFFPSQRPSPSQLNAAIKLSANYLERVCNPAGTFAYWVDTESGRVAKTYNIVRHAGAIYAIAMFNRSHPERKAVNAIIRAANFLRTGKRGQGKTGTGYAFTKWFRNA
jgi:mannose/cellobiose epimerase-like protein (N-acyl-D-glucosamine 2-epimerase family)